MKAFNFAVFTAAIVAALSGAAQAGDYFVYRSPEHKIVLSNQRPPAGSLVLQSYSLNEVTDGDLRLAEIRDEAFWIGLKIEQRAEAVDRLATEIAKQNGLIAAAAARPAEPAASISVSSSSAIVNVRPRPSTSLGAGAHGGKR